MNQQNKSTFVTVLAWIFIALAGFATFISVFQNIMIWTLFPVEEMNKAFESSPEQMPFFFKFMFANIRLFFFGFLVVSGTTLISAIGMLKRKNWGRLIFIFVMGLGIIYNMSALIFLNAMLTTMSDFSNTDIDTPIFIMMTIMKIVTFVFVIAFSYLFGWLIYKLKSPKIRSEFVPAMPFSEDAVTEMNSTYSKKKKIFLTCGIALTIIMGVFYFSTGQMKTGSKTNDVIKLATSGNAVKLTELLREQPQLANTIQPGDRWTPLHAAACNGHTECVRILINAGADVNVQACNQKTALHCGAEEGNIEIVELLLKAKANPNLKDSKGKTPLDWGIWNNHQEVVDLLKKYNAKTGSEI